MKYRVHNLKASGPKCCGSCKRGGNYGVRATVYAEGKRGDGMPYRGYLCDNHLEVALADGYSITFRKL